LCRAEAIWAQVSPCAHHFELAVQSAAALASGARPSASGVTLAAADVSLGVLTPLAYAKRRLGGRMASRAL
jgi:hypothetical protein